MGDPEVVVTLTTIPSGYDAVTTVLDKFCKDTYVKRIYLNLPVKFAKTGEEYPPPRKEWHHPKLIINRCHDHGPITKILPTLQEETNPDTLIFIVDDDNVPSDDVTKNFLKWHRQYPEAVLTTGGWVRGYGKPNLENPLPNLPVPFPLQEVASGPSDLFSKIWSYQSLSSERKNVRDVDWVEGAGGIFGKRKWFEGLEEVKTTGTEKDLDLKKLFWKHDDHWISRRLFLNGAKLKSIPEIYSTTSLAWTKGYNISGSGYKENIKFMKEVHRLSGTLAEEGIYNHKPYLRPLPLATRFFLYFLAIAFLFGFVVWFFKS